MSGMAQVCSNSNSETTGVDVIFYVDGTLVGSFGGTIPPAACLAAPAMLDYSISTGSHSVTFALSGFDSDFIENWDDRIDILTP